jgi:AraC family transcriptional activator of pobA
MAAMKQAAPPLLLVPFTEVRHDQPDDCLHYEPVAVRGEEMDWTIPAHRHEALHQFQLLVRGTVRGAIDGQAFEAESPALLMLAPGSVHGFTYTRDAVGHQVTVPTATLRQLLGANSLAQSALGTSFVRSGAELAAAGEECARLFAALAREFQAQAPGRVQALLAHATLLAVNYLRSRGEAEAGGAAAALPDTLVRRYRSLLEVHFRSPQPLAFYADALDVTPDHLSRICRKVSGQSALELLNGRRMLEARRLLAYTPMPVAEVARELGYEDPAYFSRFFTRHVGDTPTGYRQAVAAGVRDAAGA